MALPIPKETDQPNPGPKSTNPIESQLMAMTTQEDLQRELDSVRANYKQWRDDETAIQTQTRLAQIIHIRANQIGVKLH